MRSPTGASWETRCSGATRPARPAARLRAFLHESRRRWGTPESPCPILGLAPGGECWGLVFEVPDDESRLVQTRAREARGRRGAPAGDPDDRDPRGPGGRLGLGLAGVERRGGTDLEAVEARLRAAHGVVGTGPEYVRTLVHAMEPHGIQDPLVETLWKRLQG